MKTKIIAIAISALALSTPAMAQDADKTGLYGAVHAGVNMPSKLSLNTPNLDFDVEDGEGEVVTIDDVGVELDTKNAFEFGATLGYDFGMIRADIDVSYSRARVKSLAFKTVNGEAIPDGLLEAAIDVIGEDYLDLPEDVDFDGNSIALGNNGGKIRRLSAMANVWVDIPVSGFTPYVGGGLGIQGLEYDGEGKGTFTWQLGAGVSVPVNENIAVSADYRYRQQKGFSLKDEGFEYLRVGTAKSSSLFVSLRANF